SPSRCWRPGWPRGSSSPELHDLACLQEDDVLGHVGDAVADPLQVVRDEHQGHATKSLVGGAAPVGDLPDQVVEDAMVEAVDLVVSGRHLPGPDFVLLAAPAEG